MDRLKREPALLIGAVAAGILAVIQTLVGEGIIGPDVADTVGRALGPDGWALPIIVGFITRFFVFSPPTVKQVAATAAATGNPTVNVTPP